MGWAEADMDLVKQCAQTVLRVAKQILTDLTPSVADTDDDTGAPAETVETVESHPTALAMAAA